MNTETSQQTEPTPKIDLRAITLRQWCLVVQDRWPDAELHEYPGLISALQGGRRFDKILEQHYKEQANATRA